MVFSRDECIFSRPRFSIVNIKQYNVHCLVLPRKNYLIEDLVYHIIK